MTKGHNKGRNNDADPKNKTPGQDRHLKEGNKDKNKDSRNPDPDPSDGTKGQNSIS